MIAVLSCWLYFEPVSGMWLEIIKACTCLGLTFLIPDVVSFICFVFFLPEFGQEWKRKIRSRHGTNSEPDWPFTMGLQNIWRTRFQEGHNCIKGIRWQQSWRWTLSHLIIPYPFFFFFKTQTGMPCHAVNFLLATPLFLSLFMSAATAYLFPWQLNPLE